MKHKNAFNICSFMQTTLFGLTPAQT